jgi:hypothetical protein
MLVQGVWGRGRTAAPMPQLEVSVRKYTYMLFPELTTCASNGRSV